MIGREVDATPADGSGLSDSHGRSIDYLRVSLTDRCPFRCLYCLPPEGAPSIPHAQILSYEELLRLCRIAASLGISRYKITGGEPLCRKNAIGFIRGLKSLPGVANVTLTTNGALLGERVPELAMAGVDSVTVSLDAFTQETFSRITRSGARLSDILNAMDMARDAGMRVKINVVPLQGINGAELLPLTRHALGRGYEIRFIELMPVGKGKEHTGMRQGEIRALLEDAFGALEPVRERTGNGPAECLRARRQGGAIGFISPLSHAFCGRCNRVRLTASGFLQTCLHHADGCDLKALLRSGASDAALAGSIRDAVRTKPRAHNFASPAAAHGETPFLMNSIGG